MTALEEIQSAILKLTELKAIGWPCEQWTQSAIRHIARNCEIECHNEDEHECDGWLRYETAPAISLLVRTIDAQLAILRAALIETYDAMSIAEIPYWYATCALARAINGGGVDDE
jgi:hypothetical protein